MITENIGLFGGTFNPVHYGHIAMVRSALEEGLDRVIIMPCWLSPHKLSQAGKTTMVNGKHRYNMLCEAFQNDPRIEISKFEIDRQKPSFTYLTLDYIRQQNPHSKLVLMIGWDQFEVLNTWTKFSDWSTTIEFLVFPRNIPVQHARIHEHSTFCRNFSSAKGQCAIEEASCSGFADFSSAKGQCAIEEASCSGFAGFSSAKGQCATEEASCSDEQVQRNYENLSIKTPPFVKNLTYKVTKNITPISSTEVRNTIYEGGSIQHLVPSCVADYIIKNHFYTTRV